MAVSFVFPSPHGALLERPRLLAALDRSARLTIVRAPVGYGKSTLLAQWAAARANGFDTRHWIRLHNDADDAALDALIDAAPGTQQLIVVELVDPWPIDSRLLQRLATADGIRTVLIASSPAQVPDHWVALTGATFLGARDLAFSAEECTELMDGDLAPGRAADLHQATAGWPALVRIAMARLDDTTEPDASVAEYLAERIAEIHPEARTVLERAAVLGSFTESDIVELGGASGRQLSGRCEEIESAGFALRASGGSGGRWRWQVVPAVQRVVLAVLAQTDQARLRGLHQRAIDLKLAREDAAGALLHSAGAADWTRAVEILDDHWYRLITEWGEVVREVALQIPEAAIAHRPDFLFGRDVALGMSPSGTSTSLLRLPPVESLPPPRPVQAGGDGTRAAVFGMWRRLSRARRTGDYARGMAIRAEMAETIAEARPAVLARNHDMLPLLYLQWGVTSLLAGDDDLAREDFRRCYDSPAQGQGEFAQRVSAADLGLLAALAGDLPTAKQWLERASSAAPLRGFFAKTAMYGEHVATAMTAIESLDLDAARTPLAITSKSVDRNEFWAFHLLAKSRIAVLTREELPTLTQLRALRSARARVLGAGYHSARLLAVAEAELLLSTGAALRAGAVLDGAGNHPMVLATRATQLLQLGDTEQAATVAGAVIWAERGGALPRATACLVRAAASLTRGREQDATTAFQMGIGFAREFGLRRVLGTISRTTLTQLLTLTGIDMDVDQIPQLYPEPTARAELSNRERLVLSRLAEGLQLDELASALYVTRNTLKTQLRSLYRKLDVHTMEDAIAEGQRQGFLGPELE